MPGLLGAAVVELTVGVALLLASIALALADFLFGPVLALAMCASRFAIIWVWHQMRHTMRFTAMLTAASERRLKLAALPAPGISPVAGGV